MCASVVTIEDLVMSGAVPVTRAEMEEMALGVATDEVVDLEEPLVETDHE